jgi:hypothetical protein
VTDPLRPIDLDDVLARVTTQCPSFASVQEAVSALVAAESGDFRSPGAFVLEAAESPIGSPNGSGGSLVQPVMVEIGILTGVTNVRDPRAAANMPVMRKARGELRIAMLGWVPLADDQGRPQSTDLVLGSSRPFGFANATYWFLDSFRCMRLLSGRFATR